MRDELRKFSAAELYSASIVKAHEEMGCPMCGVRIDKDGVTLMKCGLHDAPPPLSPESEEVKAKDLNSEIAAVLNKYSAENGSDTPDFILAQYLLDCLAAFDKASQARKKWYAPSPGS